MSKFTKLFKNPYAFFKDAVIKKEPHKKRDLKSADGTFSINPYAKGHENSSVCFHLVSSETSMPNPALPNAYILGFGEHKRSFYAKELSDYNVYSLDLPVAKQQAMSLKRMFRKVHFNEKDIVVVWGRKDPKGLFKYIKDKSLSLHRVEDGFIRSVDLGGLHSTPLSYVYDTTGIYFDAQAPSDLEVILDTYDFESDPGLIERARCCMEKMLKQRISKYNFADSVDVSSIHGRKERRRILVIGQVEDDASIQYGCNREMNNNALVIQARLENPDAEIVYKPHPDVLTGLRKRLSDPSQVESIAEVLYDPVPIADALETVDHVYTITSLAGFEALMRGIEVTTFGAPFYSGWGLTDDRQPVARRGRKLSVEAIFAAAYILYPRYLNPFTKERIQIEEALDLLEWMKRHGIHVSDVLNGGKTSALHIKRSKDSLRVGDFATSRRFADFAVSADPNASAYVQRAKVSIASGIVDKSVQRDLLTACEIDGWKNPAILGAYARFLWEFRGYDKELHQVAVSMSERNGMSKEQKLMLAAMFNSGAYYDKAIKMVESVNSENHQPCGVEYLELAHTCSGMELCAKEAGLCAASHIRKVLKQSTFDFEKSILDAEYDFCVVGNSPREIGGGKGREIDARKLVIRFNGYSTQYPFVDDYGRRTDVWVRFPRLMGITERNDFDIKQVIVSGSNWPHRMEDGLKLFSGLIADYSSVGTVPFDVYRRLVSEMKSVPSAGMQVLFWIYTLIGPIPRGCVFGFELTDQPKNRGIQYGCLTQRVVRHDWEKERAMFDLIVAKLDR
ncbi:MAG: hypothetical protein AB9866_16730 [Syntrophobacteraceae bacterium]